MSRLSPEARRHLLALGQRRELKRGHVLLREGDAETPVYVLLQGTVVETVLAETGVELLTSVMADGDVIGDVAALTHQPQAGTCKTRIATLATVIPGPDFAYFVSRDPVVAAAYQQTLVDRLQWTHRRRLDLLRYDVEGRLANVLLELANRHGWRSDIGMEVGVDLTQAELAALIAAREGTVQKALRRLSQQGIVSHRRRRLTILKIHHLQHLIQVAGLTPSR